jgi:hypothetical protein
VVQLRRLQPSHQNSNGLIPDSSQECLASEQETVGENMIFYNLNHSDRWTDIFLISKMTALQTEKKHALP